jgi:uncharacterized repeat protein (TIGR01451 family)
VNAPKLDLEFTGPASAVVGDPVTYHFKLANIGSGDASKVYLRNILPEGLNHPGGSDLEYEVGTLKAGEVKEIDLTVNATKAGEFTNKAVISATGGLQKEAVTKVKIIGDRITITRTGPKRRYVGRTASFSNTIANQSDAKVAPVHVVEVIPAGMDFVEASQGGKFDPQKRTVTWAIAELGPSENQLLKLELLAREEGPQASEVTAYDPNGTRAAVKSETTVEGYTALRLDVREYAEPVDVGDQVGLRVVATGGDRVLEPGDGNRRVHGGGRSGSRPGAPLPRRVPRTRGRHLRADLRRSLPDGRGHPGGGFRGESTALP